MARLPRRGLVRFIVTVGLGYYILRTTELSAVWDRVAGVAPVWIGLAVVLYAVDRLLTAYKWQLLFEAHGNRLGLGRAFTIYLQSSFLGAALPATVGMDVIRAGMVRREAGSFSFAISSVVVERLMGIIALGVCALVGLVLLGSQSAWLDASWVLVATGLMCGAVIAFMVLPAFRSRRTGSPAWLERVTRFLRDLRRWLRSYNDRPGLMGAVFGLALTQQYLFIAINWILALALGVIVPALEFLWIWPVVMMAVRLPISILGFGVREAVLLGFFARGGFAAEQAVSLGLLSGLLDLLFIGLGGVLLLVDRESMRRAVSVPEKVDSVLL